MAIISTSIVGSSIISGVNSVINLEYNIIKFNGESIVDKVLVVDYAMTTAELDAMTAADVHTWDEHTLLYAEFSNNLEAGSITVASTIDSWDIIRFKTGSTIPEVIETGLPSTTTSLVDYTAVKPNTYYYLVYPITSTAVISYLQSNTVTMCYDYYAFLDETTGDSFIFQGNLEDQTVTLNSAVATYEGFTQYPAKSQGLLKYDSGAFVALLGMVNSGVYEDDTVDTYAELRDFIANGHEKIMKDRKGNIRRVFTEDLTRSIDEKPSEMPTMIAFQWTEVGEV